MILEVNEQEQLALEQVLDEAIRDLGPEIRRCSEHDFKQQLKEQRHILEDLFHRLSHVDATVACSDRPGDASPA